MKYLIFVTLLAASKQFSFAQAPALLLSTPSYKYHEGPNPDVIDTSSIKKLNDAFYTATARLDHMPVLLPYGVRKNMPNPGRAMQPPENMPNLWERPASDTIRKTQRNPLHRFYRMPDSSGIYKNPDYRKKIAPLRSTPYNKQY